MKRAYKYLLFCLSLQLLWNNSSAQSADDLCDSVFYAVQKGSRTKLEAICPQGEDLRTLCYTGDSANRDYQVEVRRKELSYRCKRDMKALVKWAKAEKVNLRKLELKRRMYQIQTNAEGYRYARVTLLCAAGKRELELHFVLIEVNGRWFYVEGLRINET